MGGTILLSKGGIHWPHNAPVLGNAGPWILKKCNHLIIEEIDWFTSKIPIRIRIKIRSPTCVLAAIGVSNVRIPDTKIPQPNTHLAPKRSANAPINKNKTKWITALTFSLLRLPPISCERIYP